jgi:hypothetical protein
MRRDVMSFFIFAVVVLLTLQKIRTVGTSAPAARREPARSTAPRAKSESESPESKSPSKSSKKRLALVPHDRDLPLRNLQFTEEGDKIHKSGKLTKDTFIAHGIIPSGSLLIFDAGTGLLERVWLSEETTFASVPVLTFIDFEAGPDPIYTTLLSEDYENDGRLPMETGIKIHEHDLKKGPLFVSEVYANQSFVYRGQEFERFKSYIIDPETGLASENPKEWWPSSR